MAYVKMCLKLADFPDTERLEEGEIELQKYKSGAEEFGAAQKFFA